MDRREGLAALLALGLLPAPLRAAPTRTPRLGYLSLEPIAERPSRERQALLDGLRAEGLVPGTSIELVYRSAEGEPEFLRSMCEELVRVPVDVLATPGSFTTLAALATTRTIPIVFLALGDPVGIGATQSLARPTRNATGTTFISSELAGKRIELLRLAAPDVKRLAILWDRRNRNAQFESEGARNAGTAMGLTVEVMPVDSQNGLASALERLAAHLPDALYVSFATGLISANRTAIAEFGLQRKLPVISGWSFMTEAGGLLSYAPDIEAMFRRSAYYVAQILRGAMPGDLPIERASEIELVVNIASARRLGLVLPAELLLRANRLID